jgi:hypothetical protein
MKGMFRDFILINDFATYHMLVKNSFAGINSDVPIPNTLGID